MYGISEIASYIPLKRRNNLELIDKFETNENFINNKLGVRSVTRKEINEETSDLCLKAFNNLVDKSDFNREHVDVIIVVTQNPDKNIPHTSAILHGKLGLKEDCAAFDISLGCSGYVYALSVISSFMEKNELKVGLLFTCDPYSKIINENDKNTSLLFGDAATVSVISEAPMFALGKFTFGTIGASSTALECNNGELTMNGRDIFNFAAKYIPNDIENLLIKNKIGHEKIDVYLFHQGSKYIIDTLTRRMNLEKAKVKYDILDYGNTVSSSIPILLEKEIESGNSKYIVISGFGVGLSWSSGILTKIGDK
ncbi:MAG: ketoacyl-ACP synthase III [Melioribacteraceae bacterium]|jgi:3-oxoacyl-[acyl-carrier-protein] synthase-3|nr:ketoacyl-ACP synthase III [Melioribacteraceae bacterium]